MRPSRSQHGRVEDVLLLEVVECDVVEWLVVDEVLLEVVEWLVVE